MTAKFGSISAVKPWRTVHYRTAKQSTVEKRREFFETQVLTAIKMGVQVVWNTGEIINESTCRYIIIKLDEAAEGK